MFTPFYLCYIGLLALQSWLGSLPGRHHMWKDSVSLLLVLTAPSACLPSRQSLAAIACAFTVLFLL